MVPPQHELVIQDCDAAIKLDANYVKALNRRAMAHEHLEQYAEALRGMRYFSQSSANTNLNKFPKDFTATTLLEKFTNQSTQLAVERVLKTMSTKKAQEILKARTPRLPPVTFIQAYFAAFRPRPHPTVPENQTPSTGDSTLLKAFEALDAHDYTTALSLVNEAIDAVEENSISWTEGKAEALNLRGTFKYVYFLVSMCLYSHLP